MLGIKHLHVSIEDNPFEDLIILLDGLCAWIEDALPSVLNQGSKPETAPKMLVHCHQGISRSGAVVVTYMMRALSLDYEATLARARESRSIIAPNSGFADQLRLWHEMEYSIFMDSDHDADSLQRKTKPEYDEWKANRGVLLSKGEEEKHRILSREMAVMASEIGWRRLDLKKRE